MKTKIAWTEITWNPSSGCTKISPGCQNCYAERMAIRLQAIGIKGYENGFSFNVVPSRLNDPLKRKKTSKFFVNSMSDIFHEKMPEEYLNSIFDIMKKASHHTYQVLTKRANRLYEYLHDKNIPENIWLGVTVDTKKEGLPRLDVLRTIKAPVRFVSMEPLLEDLGAVDLSNIDWVILGGESGHKARPMNKEWVLNIKNQCDKNKVAFFFKQWGTWGEDGKRRSAKANGCTIDGQVCREWPTLEKRGCGVTPN